MPPAGGQQDGDQPQALNANQQALSNAFHQFLMQQQQQQQQTQQQHQQNMYNGMNYQNHSNLNNHLKPSVQPQQQALVPQAGGGMMDFLTPSSANGLPQQQEFYNAMPAGTQQLQNQQQMPQNLAGNSQQQSMRQQQPAVGQEQDNNDEDHDLLAQYRQLLGGIQNNDTSTSNSSAKSNDRFLLGSRVEPFTRSSNTNSVTEEDAMFKIFDEDFAPAPIIATTTTSSTSTTAHQQPTQHQAHVAAQAPSANDTNSITLQPQQMSVEMQQQLLLQLQLQQQLQYQQQYQQQEAPKTKQEHHHPQATPAPAADSATGHPHHQAMPAPAPTISPSQQANQLQQQALQKTFQEYKLKLQQQQQQQQQQSTGMNSLEMQQQLLRQLQQQQLLQQQQVQQQQQQQVQQPSPQVQSLNSQQQQPPPQQTLQDSITVNPSPTFSDDDFMLPSTMVPPSVLADTFAQDDSNPNIGANNDGTTTERRRLSTQIAGGKPRKRKRQAGASQQDTEPHKLFEKLLQQQGYTLQRIKAEEAQYDATPSALQLASFGTHLVRAVHTSDSELLSELLECGLSPNPCNQFRDSIVDLVCKRANPTIFTCLVQHGCDLQTADGFGRTPLHHCCWASNFCLPIVEMILQADPIQLMIEDTHGQTPLEYVRGDLYPEWIIFLQNNICKYFPKGGQIPKLISPKSKRPEGTLADPTSAISVSLAAKVSSGHITPEQVSNMDEETRRRFSKQQNKHKIM